MFPMVGWIEVEKFVMNYPKQLLKLRNCLLEIESFLDRTEGYRRNFQRRCLAYGLTGPNLRAPGLI